MKKERKKDGESERKRAREGPKWAAEKWQNCENVYRTIAKKMKQMAILLFLVFSDSIDFNGFTTTSQKKISIVFFLALLSLNNCSLSGIFFFVVILWL